MNSKDNSLPFQASSFEIQDEANTQTGEAKVIQHLSLLVVTNAVDGLGVHHDRSSNDEVRDVNADVDRFVDDIVLGLLFEFDPAQSELYRQRVIVGLLQQTVAENIDHLHCGTNDLLGFRCIEKFPFHHKGFLSVFIRVHPWLKTLRISRSEGRIDTLKQRRTFVDQSCVHLHKVSTGFDLFDGGFGTIDTAHADDHRRLGQAIT